ncbi:MAG: YfbK domain-containing protein, partial [Hydrogenophaga sp.]|uniref:YfbK domain-containing protein n=1 Tax=Hydrogenophaga sp. TaxID=1904254 RepID=UPI003D9B9B49
GARGAIDPLRYGAAGSAGAANTTELAHLRLRYKRPGQSSSELMETPIRREAMRPLDQADTDFRFATAVAGFGQVLRGGRHTGGWTVADARALASASLADDRFGYRGEFLRLAGLAQALAK